MYNKRKYLKANDKKVLHKVKKQWVTISLALLMAIGGGAVATHVSVSADTTNQPKAVNIQSSASSATSSKASSASSSASSQVASSSAVSSSANQPKVSLTLGNPAPTVPYSVINPTYNQNFHFNVKQGTFGDIEGIVPQMNGSKVSSYNVYNMENPRPDASYWDFSWSRYNTPDFSHFTPVNNTNNNNNVAISGNTFMGYMTSGSIINNDGKLTHDTYGHTIDPNAHLAYFANNGGVNIWLAYSNNGEQYQPYSNSPVISEGNYGIGGDFRDPFVMRNPKNSNEFNAYIAGGANHCVFVFTSNDGIHWAHNSNNDISLNGSGVAETPNVQVLDGKPVMFTSCEPLWPGNIIGYVYYTNGHFDNNGLFKADSNTITKLDTGLDNYAPSYVPVDNNTIVGIGKLQDWGYSPNGDTLHLGSFLLPRIIQRNNDDMEVTPIETGALNQVSSKSLNANDNVNVDAHNKLSVNFNQPVSQFNLDLKRNDGTNNNIDFSLNNGALTIHRQDNDLNSHQDEARTTALGTNQLSNIEFYLDNDSVEAYVPEIHKVFTWADYTGTQNATYTLNTNVPVQANIYDFNLSQAPTLDNINNISAQYSSDKSQLNNDLSIINGNLSGNDANSANAAKSLLDSYFNDINNDLSNAQANIDKYNNYNNDARQHVFTALANINMDMANTKLYQASFQLNTLNSLSNSINTNNYITNDYAYDLTPDSFTNVNGFLTAHSWYRPKGIHQNGTNWRPSQRTNANDYHDFRPVLMHWWPSKNVQVDYLNYMHQHGMTSQSYSNSDSQSQLNQATNEVQDNIEKQISQNGNNGMNNATETLFNNFISSEPQWNINSEQSGGASNQGGYFAFQNSALTPWANSNYREYNRSAGLWNRHNNNHSGLEFLLANDIDTSNPAVLAENINNLYYILNIGSVHNGDKNLHLNNPDNFDGIREDASGSMDYDWTDIAADLMNDMYNRKHNDLNADNHLSILEDDAKWLPDLNANSNNRGALAQDQEFLGQLSSSLLNWNNQPFNIANSDYAHRGNDYTEDQAQPNYSRVGYHDNLQFMNVIEGMAGGQSNLSALENAAKTYDDDAFNTTKHYGQYYNFPAAYAIMLTNKDTVPEVFYGDLYEGYKPYMSTKTPYYDAISALLNARKKYVAGGQQMNTYDGGHILSSVRFGKDNNFTDNYGGHQILKPTDDVHTSNDPTTGLAIIVNNNPNLNPSNSITVNMGAAHGNQEYKPLMISANTSDGFNFNSTERLTTNAQGQLIIPANDLKGYKNPQNSGSLSVWVPANAPVNQDARTLTTNSTPNDSFDRYIYHSNATLDSHVLYESFSAFMPLNHNNYSTELQKPSTINLLKNWGITDFRFPPYYTPVQNDHSFSDATDQNGYAFQDRYDLGITRPNKYGTINDLLHENNLFHKAGIHTLADVVDNQVYDLPNKEIVPVERVDWSFTPYPYGSTNYINHDLYDDNTDSSNSQMQYQYGGKYLKQLSKRYHNLFTTPMVSTNQTLPDNNPIRNWSAKYMNGSNIQGHGANSVLRDASNKYYMVNNTGHSYVPTAFASINQQTDDNYAQAGASAADAQIAQHQKASVANSVAQANQKAAQNAAHTADENILNQQKASVAASVRAANQQKANQAAQQADQRITQQQRTSVANSVAAANRTKANHAAQVADQNILNQQKQSVANSVNAANQAKAKDAAQKADQIIANSVATSVATANHQAATSAANAADKSIENSIASSYAESADTSIVNSYKNSINASVSAANSSYAKTTAGKAAAKSDASSADKSIESSIASSYAKSADNSIANSYKNSVNASVSSANQSRANSAASAADQSIKNSEKAKNAQNTTPVTPSPAPFVPMFNPVTPSSETTVSNSSASSTVMPASESASESNTSNKATKHVTHHNNTHKIALVGVNKRAYFTGRHFEAKFTPKMRKHATVLEATIKSNHSVAYKVRVGKHIGYVYGYLTKLAKPSFFMYKNNHAYIHFGKKAIRVYTKNFKFIRINKLIQYNNHKYIRYDVTYGRKHGVMYGKLPAVKKVSHSKYYQLMPKHYHYAKVIKPLCIYNSKYFSKRTRRGVISKGITVRIKRVVKADKTTRFELTNGKFITGLRSFTKLV